MQILFRFLCISCSFLSALTIGCSLFGASSPNFRLLPRLRGGCLRPFSPHYMRVLFCPWCRMLFDEQRRHPCRCCPPFISPALHAGLVCLFSGILCRFLTSSLSGRYHRPLWITSPIRSFSSALTLQSSLPRQIPAVLLRYISYFHTPRQRQGVVLGWEEAS